MLKKSPPEKTGRAARENEEEGRTATFPHTPGRRPPSTTRRSASASWLMAEKAQPHTRKRREATQLSSGFAAKNVRTSSKNLRKTAMKILDIFKKKTKKADNGSFAEFFRTASAKEQIRVFTKAAELANEEQRKLMEEVTAR